MKHENLFSIGKLSQLTGVHAQSLRYYEKLGILLPAYIDPDTNYRYYSYPQIKIVEAIQYCVELDIPLSDFSSYIADSGEEIDYAKLIDYGRISIKEKIEKLQKQLRYFEYLQSDIDICESYLEGNYVVADVLAKAYFCLPFDGTRNDSAFYDVTMQLLEELHALGRHTGYDIGMLARFKDNDIETFAYIDIREPDDEILTHSKVIHIPDATFVCTKRTESNIFNAPNIFPAQFAKSNDLLIIEKDYFTSDYQYNDPLYDVRCLLKKAEL